MKICTRCKVEKNEEDFAFKYKAKGIRMLNCRSCHKIYVDKHYQNNKQIYKNKSKIYNAKAKQEFTEYKKTLSCTDCNMSFEDKYWLCVFHHLDPSKKEIEISVTKTAKRKLKKELEKCIPLCSNCHITRHHHIYQGDIV